MAEPGKTARKRKGAPVRLKKPERRQQILLELRLRPHVRISDLADRFNVSTETVRRDFDALADDGLISRAHGGATASMPGHYPGLDERSGARITERERIGQLAATLVRDGETLMVDSGSTTLQMARALSALETPCTVITNSIPIAMTLGQGLQQVLMCPGEYLPAESAVIGTETLEFLDRFNVDRCMIGASGLSLDGPNETVRGFAAVKRAMLRRARHRHLLVDSDKFDRKGLNVVGALDELDSVVTDRRPDGELAARLENAGVEMLVASQPGSARDNR